MDHGPVSQDALESHLRRVLGSVTFRSADRSRRLLEFIVRETLEGRAERLKDYTLGAEALGRGEQFDPRTDPIARVEASRLRSRLEVYYATEGAADEVRIVVPKGGYVPAFEVRAAAAAPAAPSPEAPATPRPSPSLWPVVAAGGMLVVAALAWWGFARPGTLQIRLEMTTPATTDPASFAVAPDGKSVVFVGGSDGESSLWMRRLDETAPSRLSGTAFASLPFWSPDGSAIGFFAEGRIRSVHLQTGVVRTIATALVPAGAAWSPRGVVLHPIVPDSPLIRTSVEDGGSEPATTVAPGQTGHRGPVFLPDGRRFLFYATGRRDVRGIHVGELGSTAVRRLLDADTPAAFVSPGHLIYVHQSRLFVHDFDLQTATLAGDPVVIAEDVASEPGSGLPAVSVGAHGTIAYRTGPIGPVRQFTWFDRHGRDAARVGTPDPRGPAYGAMSPDGRRLAFQRSTSGNTDIWLVDLDRGVSSLFTSDPGPDIAPMWSPRGDTIAYSAAADGVLELFEKPLAGGEARLLLRTGQPKQITDWSRDGRHLLYRSVATTPVVDMDIWAMPLDGDRTPFAVVRTPFEERDAQFSPDARWIAYQSNESGRHEVYVQPFNHAGDRQRISPDGGVQARWRADGRELFYVTPEGTLMAVAMTLSADGHSLTPGSPVALFRMPAGPVQGIALPGYVVSPDGQRFLVDALLDQQPAPISLILNWRR
jgi:Tol biopolymer transport system component